MLKAPPLISSGLYNSDLQDRPDRGDLYMFKNMFEKVLKYEKKVENVICLTIQIDKYETINVTYLKKFIIRPQYYKNIFFNFGQILTSEVRQLHFITDKCRSDEIRGGDFSIRL